MKSFWKVEKASEKEKALESELNELRRTRVCDELMKHQLGEDLECEKYENVSLRRELAECRASRVCHCLDVKEEPKRKPVNDVLKHFLGPDAMMMEFMKQGVCPKAADEDVMARGQYVKSQFSRTPISEDPDFMVEFYIMGWRVEDWVATTEIRALDQGFREQQDLSCHLAEAALQLTGRN